MGMEQIVENVGVLVIYWAEEGLLARLNGKVTRKGKAAVQQGFMLKDRQCADCQIRSRALPEVQDCYMFKIRKEWQVELTGVYKLSSHLTMVTVDIIGNIIKEESILNVTLNLSNGNAVLKTTVIWSSN